MELKPHDLLSEIDLCSLLGKSQAWAQRARWDGTGPRFVKVGRTPMYRRADVDTYLETRARHSTAEGRT